MAVTAVREYFSQALIFFGGFFFDKSQLKTYNPGHKARREVLPSNLVTIRVRLKVNPKPGYTPPYYSVVEDHKWKRIATWACGLLGLACFGAVSNTSARGVLAAILLGLILMGMAVFTLIETNNWHTYNGFPDGKKVIPLLTVGVAVVSVVPVFITLYFGWKAISSSRSGAK